MDNFRIDEGSLNSIREEVNTNSGEIEESPLSNESSSSGKTNKVTHETVFNSYQEKSKLEKAVKISKNIATLPFFIGHLAIKKVATKAGIASTEAKTIDKKNREILEMRKDAKEISFGFQGGPKLEGMLFGFDQEKQENTKTILLCTGSHDSFESYAVPMVAALREQNYRVMVFNYEGFGKSEGSPSEKGVYRSAEAAYYYLKEIQNCTDEEIVGWGYSLGSAAVTHLAEKGLQKAVLDRPISTMAVAAEDELDKYLPENLPKFLSKDLKKITKKVFEKHAHFDNLSKVSKFKEGVLIAQEKEFAERGKAFKARLESDLPGSTKWRVIEGVCKDHFHTFAAAASSDSHLISTNFWFAPKKGNQVRNLFDSNPENIEGVKNFIESSNE